MGRGIRGAPITPSKSWSSVFRPPKMEGGMEEFSACGRIHVFMFCQDLPLLLDVNISSGMGTSRTVSKASSRSKLGYSFLMRVRLLVLLTTSSSSLSFSPSLGF